MLQYFNWALWWYFFTLIIDKKVYMDITFAMIIGSNVSFPFLHSLRLIMDPDVMASSQLAWWSTGRAMHQHHTVHGCGPVQAGFFQSILLFLLEKMGYHKINYFMVTHVFFCVGRSSSRSFFMLFVSYLQTLMWCPFHIVAFIKVKWVNRKCWPRPESQ